MTPPSVTRSGLAILLTVALPLTAHAADILAPPNNGRAEQEPILHGGTPAIISGRVSVIDGRTLWFSNGGHMVRLSSIDTCELPQWSFDPKRHGESSIPKPAPCGPLAKAWLKRSVGDSIVKCAVRSRGNGGVVAGRCTVGGKDLALEMLRVGWARVEAAASAPPQYRAWQRHAMSARYGMWATYVVDTDEWRAKAVDKTLSRRPIADFNLLAERESEISPPFEDARRRPKRTDR
jgi:endonuclease YncB( thermonuclease family)